MRDQLFALSRMETGASLPLKIFFGCLELLLLGAGVYIFRARKNLFSYREGEGDTYASANLRLAMVVWSGFTP